MSEELMRDLALLDEGLVSASEVQARHPDESLEQVLAIHDRLVSAGADRPPVPDWRDVVGRLDDHAPDKRWRRRLTAGLALLVIGVPVAAEALEEVAPDQVRDTVVDRITDILPWDRDIPETDRAPVTDLPVHTDRVEPDVPTDGLDSGGGVDDGGPRSDHADASVSGDGRTDRAPDRDTDVREDLGDGADRGPGDSGQQTDSADNGPDQADARGDTAADHGDRPQHDTPAHGG